MEFKSLVAEFEKGRHAERVKPDNLEATYTAWAAQTAGSKVPPPFFALTLVKIV